MPLWISVSALESRRAYEVELWWWRRADESAARPLCNKQWLELYSLHLYWDWLFIYSFILFNNSLAFTHSHTAVWTLPCKALPALLEAVKGSVYCTRTQECTRMGKDFNHQPFGHWETYCATWAALHSTPLPPPLTHYIWVCTTYTHPSTISFSHIFPWLFPLDATAWCSCGIRSTATSRTQSKVTR